MTRPEVRLAARGSFALLVSFLALLSAGAFSGCATGRSPLPSVTPDQLPDVWLEALEATPCPEAFRARVKMRLDLPDQPGVRLDGTLLANLPEHIRLSGKLGVFRPIFNLFAVADSSEMLIHEQNIYWITPRSELGWDEMNPSAWTEVLGWALCPRDLVSRFEASGTGRVDGREWSVAGSLGGTPFEADLVFDRKDRTLRALVLREGEQSVVSARVRDYREAGESLIPSLLELELPHPEGLLDLKVELEGISVIEEAEFAGKGLVRPPGWIAVRDGPAPVLVLPEGTTESP